MAPVERQPMSEAYISLTEMLPFFRMAVMINASVVYTYCIFKTGWSIKGWDEWHELHAYAGKPLKGTIFHVFGNYRKWYKTDKAN